MKQINVFILILLTLSCNFEKKHSSILDNFKIAEKEFNNYNTQSAINYYKSCIRPMKSEKDTMVFKAYCRLINCYYRINALNELSLTFRIVDSLYKNNIYFKRFNYDYFFACALYKHSMKSYIDAILYFQKALNMLPATDTLACFLNYKLGVCYEKLNNLNKAEFYYRKALSLARNKKQHFSNEHAVYYNTMAFIYLSKYSDFYTASLYYDSVLYISSRCRYLDSATYAWNLFHIGYFYHEKGIYTKAEQYYFEAYSIYSKLKDRTDKLMNILSYQANVYSCLKKFDIAINKIDITISYYLKNKNYSDLQESYNTKAYIYFISHDFEKAVFYYRQALKINDKFNLPGNEQVLYYIAQSFLNLNLPDSANEYFKKSMALFDKNPIKDINVFVSMYGEYSGMLIEVGRYKEALQTIESKLPYIIKTLGKKSLQYGYFIYWKALALERFNKLQLSLDVYQKVIMSSIDLELKTSIYDIPLFKSTDIISNNNIIDGLTGKGDVLCKMAMKPENKGQKIFLLKKSLQHYEKARELVENYNKQVGSESNRFQFTGSKEFVYEKELAATIMLFRITGDQNYLEKAFTASDRNKAVQLTFGMKDEQYKRIGGVPDSLIQKDKNLQEEIVLLQSSIHDENNRELPNLSLINNWRVKLLNYMNESDKLSSQIDEKYPNYLKIKYNNNDIDLADLNHLVGHQKTLIEYAFSGDSLYMFILSGNKLQLLSQPSHGIEDSIISLRNLNPKINNSSFNCKNIKSYIIHAFWLYIKLFKPTEPYLNGNEIIIIPDGMLNLLPFESLVSSDCMPKQTDYGLLPYLLYKYTFSYNYSVGLFTMQQKMKTILTNKVVAFAPKYEEIHPDQFKTSDKTVNDILFPLQSSEEEAKNVARIFGGKVISGKRATKINFLKHTSDGSVLHLAMHAIIDNEYPMDSKLVFSQSNNTKNNNFLKTYEIYNINLHSPLIVLSACNTGNGELIKGEGIISLARGFVYAGCPSMVITLWSIADQSSCEFMQLFYKNLKYNVNIDKALQQAKIQYIENSDNIFSNPFYWAGFIQIGKTDSFIYTSKNHHIVLIIVLSLCIILGIILYWFVKEKK